MTDQTFYWIKLAHCLRAHRLLISYLKTLTPKEICLAENAQLRQWGFSEKQIDYLKQDHLELINKTKHWLSQQNNHLITLQDTAYPNLLKQISNPPLLIYAKGNCQLLNKTQLAIVGSRNPTPSGKETAFAFAKLLAEHAWVITSGLAIGIDAAAHLGALKASGHTIGVLGAGLECLYPKSNYPLAQAILQNDGLLISEYWPYAGVKAHHFPERNRIISALSLGTLVVEASLGSGSLITAHMALEQNREIFAVPGSIHNPQSKGTHALLRNGAKLVENIEDILSEFPEASCPEQMALPLVENKEALRLAKDSTNLIQYIGFEPTSIETILNRSELSLAALARSLALLEKEGLIIQVSGDYFRTTGK